MNTFSPKRFQLSESEWTGPLPDGNFSRHRAEWITDRRITSYALSLYLYINSYADGEILNASDIQEMMNIPKKRFDASVKKLLDAGYLIVLSSTAQVEGTDSIIDYEQGDPFAGDVAEELDGSRDE